MNRLAVAAVVALSFNAFAAADPDDNPDAEEHPDFKRFPGFYLHNSERNDYNEIELITHWDKDSNEEKTTPLSGRYWRMTYSLKDGKRQPSAVELLKNYENAYKALKATVLTRGATKYDAHLSVKHPVGKSMRWVHVRISNGGSDYDVTILEEAEMEQKVEVTATEMLEALNKNGFIALNGIQFDTGKDTIKPESEALLAEIVTLLNSNKALKVSVEGHTDNVGNAKANEALSKKRAESVKKFLTGKGIAAARLSANGFGDTRPIADNRLEDGRAKNRRVELVKK